MLVIYTSLQSGMLISNPGVLLTEIRSVGATLSAELELHVAYGTPDIFADPQSAEHGARVEHIVIRLNTLEPDVCSLLDGDMLESMEAFMARLAHLRTVTLETPREDGDAGLAERLARLRTSGRLRIRTCKEAQQAAQVAQQNEGDCTDEQGVISPLWYLGEDKDWRRNKWYATLSRIVACRLIIPTGRLPVQVRTR